MRKQILIANQSASPLPVMLHCATVVNRDNVSRHSINGIEHITVTSFTLPDNIVMNGGLYPVDEIKASIESLDFKLAPIGHPVDENGDWLLAGHPHAIHNFHAGAYNTNIVREGNRYRVDKVINVQEALKTDRGKRLLDRIEEIENNADARPIHTSVCVLTVPEELPQVMTNAEGQEYTWIAREITFDHDAILLDEVGAAQPSQGVGMAVNKDGKKLNVQQFLINNDQVKLSSAHLSFMQLRDGLQTLLDDMQTESHAWVWIIDFTESQVFYRVDDGEILGVEYVEDPVSSQLSIVGIPQPQEVTYTPRTNSKGEAMLELLVNALKAAGVKTDGLDDAAILVAYNTLQASSSDSDSDDTDDDNVDAVTAAVNAAVKPLVEKVNSLEGKLNQSATDEVESLAQTVANSGLYPGLSEDDAKGLPLDSLRSMAANCKTSIGIPSQMAPNASQDGQSQSSSYAMPE